jgi:sn-glycerol 3-phosphate transport system ATP-binding protein
MATVNIEHVKKVYGDIEVLHDISLSIEKGQFVVVVGPSGCGKSSLLRMVAGLETVSSGLISINGLCVNDVPPAKRDIAMVFQNYALYPHMSVFKNMAYGLKIRGLSKKAIQQKVLDCAKTLQLTGYLDRKPHQLSGGQRQRVAMGRAIVREPAVFLFDEPLSNLDAKLRSEMRIEIQKLQKRLGITSLYVTHDQTEAMTLADKIVVLNEGEIEQIGTPVTLYEKPKTMFVANFLGNSSMNFLPLELVKSVFSDDFSQIYPSNVTIDLIGSLLVGIRPEHWIILSS